MATVALLMACAYTTVAFSTRTTWQLLGVVFASLQVSCVYGWLCMRRSVASIGEAWFLERFVLAAVLAYGLGCPGGLAGKSY